MSATAETGTQGPAPGETAAAGAQAGDTSDRPAQPALRKLNRLFHEVYTARGAGVWEQLRSGETPVVVRTGDLLILHTETGPTEYVITGERYHELKAACHIPAALHLALAEAASPAKEAAVLASLLDDLHDVGAGIDAMVSPTRALLEQVRMADREQDLHELLAAYRGEANRAMKTLARAAAEIEIEALDRAMRDIAARLARKRLEEAYFVICAGHQPRYKQLSKLYFRAWLVAAGWPESRILHHIVYAEDKESLEEALALVRTRIVDGRLSAALFDDLTNLDQDVLGDAAIEQLGSRFGG